MDLLQALPLRPKTAHAPALSKDAEDLFIPQTKEFTATSALSSRTLDPEGEPSPTVCFEASYLNKPHHHLLSCGHTVLTWQRLPCGRNCMLSLTAESKPKGKGFLCTHDDCIEQRRREEREASVFIPRQMKYGRRFSIRIKPEPDRPSVPSHVYGPDPEADKQRIEEKNNQAMSDISGLSLSELEGHSFNLPRRRIRKRSRSPTQEESYAHVQRSLRKHGTSILEKSSNRRLDPAEQALIESLKKAKEGLGKREKANLEIIAKDGIFGTPFKPRCIAELQQDSVVAPPSLTSDYEQSRETPHSYGNNRYKSIREFHGEYFSHPEDAEEEAIAGGDGVHIQCEDTEPPMLARDRVNDDSEEANGSDDDVPQQTDETDELERHCICECPSDMYMLPCNECTRYFHPGCIGKGHFSDEVYQSEKRKTIFKRDMEQYRRAGKVLTCRNCEAQIKKAQDAVRKRRSTRIANNKRRKYEPVFRIEEAWKDAKDGIFSLGSAPSPRCTPAKPLISPPINAAVNLHKVQGSSSRVSKSSKPQTRGGRPADVTKINPPTITASEKALETRSKPYDRHCDSCNKRIAFGDLVYRCRDCNGYDYCKYCFQEGVVHPYSDHIFRQNTATASEDIAREGGFHVVQTDVSDLQTTGAEGTDEKDVNVADADERTF